jgi:alcohol dehydrogenase
MRAVIMNSGGKVGVETVPDPTLPGPQGAVVAVAAAAICGSDLHFFDGDLPAIDGLSIGHEAVGTVVEVGNAVNMIAVGDRVMVSCIAGCGHCPGCGAGDPATCDHGSTIFGFGAGLGGAQADLLAVPAADSTLMKLPDSIDDEAALLLASMSSVMTTSRRRRLLHSRCALPSPVVNQMPSGTSPLLAFCTVDAHQRLPDWTVLVMCPVKR